jgi:hypothetical protein
MVLNPTQGGDSHNWNYSRPGEPGYSLSLTGTVVAIQEVQAMNFGSDGRPSTPAFWENSGQPKMNIRLVLAGPSGGFRTWTIQPASKAAKEGRKASVHLDLFRLAGGVSMLDLVGKTIHVVTQAPPAGFGWGLGNPRPWSVEEVTDKGPFQTSEPLPEIYLLPQVYANTAVSGGQMMPQGNQMTPQGSADLMAGDSVPPRGHAPGADEDPGEIPF